MLDVLDVLVLKIFAAKRRTGRIAALSLLLLSLFLQACGGEGASASRAASSAPAAKSAGEQLGDRERTEGAPQLSGLRLESKMETAYASGFDLYRYSGGYRVIDVHGSARYLLIPEGKAAPEGSPGDLVALPRPPEKIYLAATSAMSLFAAAGALPRIRLTGTDVDGWYIEPPREALRNGSMLYAGKYSAPDYELLTAEGCDLAIESTMILHAPEIKEMLEKLGIPVFIDLSSYEPHPLGRTEWIRLYGEMTGTEERAEAFFRGEREKMEALSAFPESGKTVAFFSFSANGSVVVRKGTDYIPKMIALAGGKYVFSELGDDRTHSSTMNISREEFYERAREADYLIYNATIEAPLAGIGDLLSKDELFSGYRAVQNGGVWQVDRNMYQSADAVGELTQDFHKMLSGEGEESMRFLRKVD